LAEKHDLLSAEARLLLFTGILGGFTTFSSGSAWDWRR
jgi:fluoride ion exporter CrcB/FEX